MRAFILWLLLSGSAWANAPAPWAVCGGKKAGDSCSSLYYPAGLCQARETGCGDDQPCLYCESRPGCALGAGGAATVAAIAGFTALLKLLRRRKKA
jgi:hypothetical protein